MPYLKHVEVSFEHAHNDYSCFENVRINLDDYGHVIEIYDFPTSFTTDDLLDAFAEYRSEGVEQISPQLVHHIYLSKWSAVKKKTKLFI